LTIAKRTKRVAVPVIFPRAPADSIMDRLLELEDVFDVDFIGNASSAHIGETFSAVVLTVRRDMSERLAVRIVKMVLKDHGLAADTGKPSKAAEI